jgi:hypothetical protein
LSVTAQLCAVQLNVDCGGTESTDGLVLSGSVAPFSKGM